MFLRIQILSFFFCFIALGCKKKEPPFNVEEKTNNNALVATIPSDFYLPTSTTGVVIKHQFYTLSYSEAHEQAEWVAYPLKREHVTYSNHRRPYFVEDPEVISGSANWKNFIRSGYDRGHLCPAGDRRFSAEAFNETFYTSNIAPQRNDFNAGVWNRLEQKTRYWAKKKNGLYVITGGVLKYNLKTIGKEHVAVPNYFYKILIENNNNTFHAIAFLLPHKETDQPLYSFVVSIDSLEKMTGIDFLNKLPDSMEANLEKNVNYKDWSF